MVRQLRSYPNEVIESAKPDSDDVLLFHEPWPLGMEAKFYGWPVNVEVVADDFNQAQSQAFERVRSECAAQGCNATVGVEVTVDPFRNGRLWLHCVGTAVFLEKKR